jgi:hypothetical protein
MLETHRTHEFSKNRSNAPRAYYYYYYYHYYQLLPLLLLLLPLLLVLLSLLLLLLGFFRVVTSRLSVDTLERDRQELSTWY